jgi:DNA replication protein DnaC
MGCGDPRWPGPLEDLDGMLSRLRLGAIRERLDGLLEEASRRQLNLREALAWLCAAEVASKEQRRLSMAMTTARFPFVRTLEGFEFEAQPSIDPGKIRDLAFCRWVSNGDNVVLLGPPGVGKTHLEVGLEPRRNHSDKALPDRGWGGSVFDVV